MTKRNFQPGKHACAALVIALLVTGIFPSPGGMAFSQSLTPATQSDANSVSADAERRKVEIAEAFWFTIRATTTDGQSVTFPEPESIGPFQVIEKRDLFNIPDDAGIRRWSRGYRLECYEGGEHQIPAMQVVVGSRVENTPALTVSVESIVEDQADPLQFRGFKEIEDIEPETWTRRQIVLAVLAAAALTVAAIAALVFYLSKQRALSATPAAWIHARLDALRKSEAFKAGDRAAILPPLADLLREYVQRRFGIAATQQTTSEFLSAIQRDEGLPEARRSELKTLLREVDQIKFANFSPHGSDLGETFDLVTSFVRKTSEPNQRKDLRVEAEVD